MPRESRFSLLEQIAQTLGLTLGKIHMEGYAVGIPAEELVVDPHGPVKHPSYRCGNLDGVEQTLRAWAEKKGLPFPILAHAR